MPDLRVTCKAHARCKNIMIRIIIRSLSILRRKKKQLLYTRSSSATVAYEHLEVVGRDWPHTISTQLVTSPCASSIRSLSNKNWSNYVLLLSYRISSFYISYFLRRQQFDDTPSALFRLGIDLFILGFFWTATLTLRQLQESIYWLAFA